MLFGGDLAVTDEFLQRSVDEALGSGDLHRQVWVLTYAGRADEAVAAALRLGNTVLLAMARGWVGHGRDEESQWEARESFWDASQRCHSYIMLNHAAHELARGHIRSGAPVDGLLLLRAPARDWLLRADIRVWSVLHTIAAGLAGAGDLVTAARLVGAIGDRYLGFVPETERGQLRSLIEAGLSAEDRARHDRVAASSTLALRSGRLSSGSRRSQRLTRPQKPSQTLYLISAMVGSHR